MSTKGTMTLIQTVTVPAGGQAEFDFINIPQTYDDLVIMFSVRSANSGTDGGSATMRFNNDSGSNYSFRWIRGDGANATSNSSSTTFIRVINNSPTAGNTASTFCNSRVYIPNYRGSTAKSLSEDNVSENNTTTAYSFLVAGLWTGTAAINRVTVTGEAGNFVQHSTATLYGITRVFSTPKATGGSIFQDSDYWYHVFTSSSTFTPSQNLTCDYLVVAGGGGGAGWYGGGGGAGGLRSTAGVTGGGGSLESALSLSSGTGYTVTVGAGGASQTIGNNSVFGSITSTGGGRGGSYQSNSGGGNGGSGGGAGSGNGSGVWLTAGTGTTGQGFNGGTGNSSNSGSPGGGGAGAAGANAGSTNGYATDGGIGVFIPEFSLATLTGAQGGYYAGGGGGGSTVGGGRGIYAGFGGRGGGGNGSLVEAANSGGPGESGTANTGGGGGGAGYAVANGGAGGSGIVIVRYAK
jgi:hypothetical protein